MNDVRKGMNECMGDRRRCALVKNEFRADVNIGYIYLYYCKLFYMHDDIALGEERKIKGFCIFSFFPVLVLSLS